LTGTSSVATACSATLDIIVAMSAKMRIGMLTPSSNTVLEPVTVEMLTPIQHRVSVHFSRFPVTAISSDPKSRAQFGNEPMLHAARLLADAKVDVIVWNGTSGGWEGIDRDRALSQTIEAETGIPATTGTLAAVEAFRTLGIVRYGLVVPYVTEISDAITATFGELGFNCVARTNEGLSVNWDFSQISPLTVAERCRTVARADPDGILIYCTNLCGAPVVAELESELGMPVLDSVVVSLWAAFHKLGLSPGISGYGTLLENS
jgi:maleate isomerase